MAWLILVLPVAFYYLGSRALITRWLWSSYSRPLAVFMDCPACVGFWYGFLISYSLRVTVDVELFKMPATGAPWAVALAYAIICGWVTMLTTPVGAAILQRALDINGSAVPDDDTN